MTRAKGGDAPRPTRVALVSLGCPKNQVDSELILGRLQAEGCELVDDPEQADTLVVNTCSFIDRARVESVEALLEAAQWKDRRRGRHVIAAGCLVQRNGQELRDEMPELDGLVGLDQIRESGRAIVRLPGLGEAPHGRSTFLMSAADPRVRLGARHSAYVKIAEGCDQKCAFCAIPTFRGRMRSRPVEDLLHELHELAHDGVVEANLVAQDSTGYGRDLGLKDGLAALVRAIDAADEAPPWIRIHYLYPGRITAGFLEAVAGARRIVPYVDLPFQHAAPAVLRRMDRPGGPDDYLRQLEALRAAMPGAGVRSAFIVGFPGETEAEFETLCEFVGAAGFDSTGVFTYSHETDTTAMGRFDDDVPPEVKDERRAVLEEIALAAAHERNRARLGETLEVLVDGPAEDQPQRLAGRWKGQAPEVDGRVLVDVPPGAAAPRAGARISVRVTEAGPTELAGVLAR